MPVLDPVLVPEPMLPEVPVLEPVEVLSLVEPVPSEPLVPVLLPAVPPAPLVAELSSLRHCSFSSPVSAAQRERPALPPAEDEPLIPVEEEPLVLEPTDGEVVLLEPTDGEVVLLESDGEVVLEPTDGELVLLPMLLEPLVWANAPDIAKRAAAVAETTSFRFICAPSRWLKTAPADDARRVPPACRQATA